MCWTVNPAEVLGSCIEVPRLVYPNLRDPVLRLQLGKGLGHNTYGEPAWPNDLLYMFPICILAIVFSAI